MSGLPNVLTMCLNMLSLSFHSEDRSNILEFLSATFSDPGIWAAETHICCSAAHYHMSKAISSHNSDLIPPCYNISYCCIAVHHDPNMFNILSFKKTKKS